TQPPGSVLVVVVLEVVVVVLEVVVVVCAVASAGRARPSAKPLMRFRTLMVAPPSIIQAAREQPECQDRISGSSGEAARPSAAPLSTLLQMLHPELDSGLCSPRGTDSCHAGRIHGSAAAPRSRPASQRLLDGRGTLLDQGPDVPGDLVRQ